MNSWRPSAGWARAGGANSPGSALGHGVGEGERGWVSELELHVSLCLPFKFLRCHLLCMCFSLKKQKTKNKKGKRRFKIAKQRRIQWHKWRRSLLDRNKVAEFMANWVGGREGVMEALL